ncbi:MAG TPA: F0F1 ATP synthase subunit epsilon [Chloroflexota bacterium]|nr:F0F1 ATP synthase subunit epsilon [Chloroflexota bacterium]
MAKLRLEVVTAEREVYADDVDLVVAPATEGEVGILPRHAPLLTTLQPGVLRLKKDGEEVLMAVSGGFLQVFNDRVLILADAAERESEIEESRAEQARQRALAVLQAAARGEPVQAEAARLALRRSLARLEVVQRRRRRRGES